MNEYKHHVDLLDENCWCDLIDYSSLLEDTLTPTDLCWNPQQPAKNAGVAVDVLLSGSGTKPQANVLLSGSGTMSQASECLEEQECPRKRARSDQCGGTGTKACRERMRREKLNDRFSELSAVLEPGRPIKSDKMAILGDAIRVLNQLKSESQEYKEMNEKLLAEIKTLKAEKNELREEKHVLKTDKERMEQQLKTVAVPPTGFVPTHPPIYQTGASKMPMFPSYGFVPMWQYLPPSARDTSQDHELRPPAA